MKRSPLLSVALLALTGCGSLDAAVSGVNNYYAGELKSVQKNVQGINDNAAQTLADAMCATPYGEVVRNGTSNPNFPGAVINLCGSPSGYTMIHSTPTATATTTIPTNTVVLPPPPVTPLPTTP